MTRWEWSNLVLSADGPEAPTVRLVLVALLTFVNDADRYGYPGVESIAKRTGHSSVRTVQEALGEAEASGWLRRVATPGRLTRYYPAVGGAPIDCRASAPLQSARGSPPQSAPAPPQETAGTPAPIAPEPGREPRRETRGSAPLQSARGSRRPACHLCGFPLDLKDSKRGGFWGCSTYRGKGRGGCPGKLQLDDQRLGEFAVSLALPNPTGAAAKKVTGGPSGPDQSASSLAQLVAITAARTKAKSIEREGRGAATGATG